MLLITNGRVITMDPERRVIRDGAVLIDGDRIKEVGKTEELKKKYPNAEQLDAKDDIVMPGLIDVHAHLFQVLMRGIGVDLDLTDWIFKSIYPISKRLFRKEAKTAALMNTVEMIKTGTTVFDDCHYINIDKYCNDGIAEAIEEIGIRGIIGRAAVNQAPVPECFHEDPDTAYKECERIIKEYHGKANGRISVRVEPMSEALSSKEMLLAMREVSRKYHVGMNMHAAEIAQRVENLRKKTGMSTIEYLYDNNILGPDVLLAHCVWVSRKEIELLKVTDTKVAHNAVSNPYLADGIAPIPEMLAAGVTVGIGCDGAASNNNQDMFAAMKMAIMMQRASRLDPSCLNAQKALEMATIDGARCLNMEDEIGSLEAGKKADVIIVSTKGPEMIPSLGFVSHLVYSTNGNAVQTVFVDGKMVMKDRELLTVDEEKIKYETEETVKRMVDESGAGNLLETGWKFI